MSVYDPKVTFVEPLIGFRHIGHFFSAGAHCAQLTKWPHGKKTIETFSSQQILHICASFINSFSFFTSSGIKKNHNFYNKWIATPKPGRIIYLNNKMKHPPYIYEWIAMNFTTSKHQQLHQNWDACTYKWYCTLINYYTFMRISTEGWEGKQPLETFSAWYLNHIN